ncbi:uncharacterized protein LOC126146479 isoform X2 [Schistocerca cancellata]|uniref:uncharacterized protein LOC126146479 isoform X2 n=1 Tax=Schistocerca cancellata TaxID=274614 RepID=UPI002118E9F7|nr:uncharacterized protein LOC126146479 isoform X2 [Schistocerca cancellata]
MQNKKINTKATARIRTRIRISGGMVTGLERVVQDFENEAQKANNTIAAVEWRLAEIARPRLGTCDVNVRTFAEISQLKKERTDLATRKHNLDVAQNKIKDSVLAISQKVKRKVLDIERIVGIKKNE